MSRSPFGWSLPPGVTDRMIDEALADVIYEALQLPDTRETDEVVERLLKLCGDVYADGYRQGQSDQFNQEKTDE